MAIGQVNKKYVSSTAFLDQREILNKVLNVTNEETSFVDVMEMMNRYVPTKVPSYHHFINEELYSSVTNVTEITAHWRQRCRRRSPGGRDDKSTCSYSPSGRYAYECKRTTAPRCW